MARPKVALILTDDERVRLDSLAHRSRTAPHPARRARIILAFAKATVCKWRGPFTRARLDGLYDDPRPGMPRRISDTPIEQVMCGRWKRRRGVRSTGAARGMAKASGLGRTTIQQIWRAFDLQPHRTETFKLSTDPLLIETS